MCQRTLYSSFYHCQNSVNVDRKEDLIAGNYTLRASLHLLQAFTTSPHSYHIHLTADVLVTSTCTFICMYIHVYDAGLLLIALNGNLFTP